ncbi:transcriptional regulator, LuxR family [Treponema socranskii subsp. socranskii VPI DR56BR1116 = ATCC 35536]|uniref:Transcriptional regulator, LuxR family n=1 Tax=Treponema socranskii subsp. socranskii VPI DR56BR1116 = ATCC 35536 TaxID=1125725 RepID=U2KGI9_TRESO|nr:response regulator transcription factor [Treponema socranskii]ERF60293.1 transcriptional regulator, LuxR family [Treponema socranskii subsp. socranskii VPI DR56BR1116 = ATCC 35536]ERJ97641.1 transcriptional regulator, LuxR family [Treponema socranskii subsp. socranskii VPI DR56BR1116 = ATCC 35536]
MIPNIILCHDHALLRNGIKSWIETHSQYKVTHEAGTWAECEKIIEAFRSSGSPNNHIAVVDISFKAEYSPAAHEENCGFEIIRRFTALGVPCIAYSSHDSGGFVEHAVSSAVGAKGFVSKNADEEILLAAIRAVSDGKTYIQAELVTGLLEVNCISRTFTKKEKLLSDALTIHNTNAEVAAALGITEKTVVNYLTILYDKAGVKNKLEFLEKMGRLN